MHLAYPPSKKTCTNRRVAHIKYYRSGKAKRQEPAATPPTIPASRTSLPSDEARHGHGPANSAVRSTAGNDRHPTAFNVAI